MLHESCSDTSNLKNTLMQILLPLEQSRLPRFILLFRSETRLNFSFTNVCARDRLVVIGYTPPSCLLQQSSLHPRPTNMAF